MGYLIHILDDDGNFELIDQALLALYLDLNSDELIPLSDEQYQAFCQQDNSKTKFIDGNFVFTVEQNVDESQLLAQRKESLIYKVVTKTDQLEAQVLAGYSKAEIASFYRQEAEARAWLADNQSPTPMLNEMVVKRPEIPSLSILVEKIIEKADTFSAVMGGIIGKKQAIETRIELAKNSEELTACEQEIEQWQLANH